MRGVWIFALASTSGWCAALSLPAQTAVPGQIFVASLAFSSQGQTVSGIQFDMDSDPAVSFGILPGAQIGVSAKVLYTATLPTGGLRVVIVGMNQGSIADGELLRPLISVNPNAAPGSAQIRISNVAATDPGGEPAAVAPASAAVQIQAGTFTQAFAAATIVNAASLLGGSLSPGEIITIWGGAALGNASTVLFNGTAGPLLYTGPGQVNAIVPFGLDLTGPATVEIRSASQSLGTASMPTASVSPALFTQSSNGLGPGAILNQDYTLNSPSNPASAGSVVMLFGTGFGQVVPAANDGQTAVGQAPTKVPVTATVGGIATDVLYAGAAPGLIEGLAQINIRIPHNLPPGVAAPVVLKSGSASTEMGVTVSTQ